MPTFYRDNQISYLNLEHNSIEEVPKPMLSSCHLKNLNLSSNQIKLIDPSEIESFRNNEKRLLIGTIVLMQRTTLSRTSPLCSPS